MVIDRATTAVYEKKTVKEKVFEYLREAILKGKLPSGQQIRQDDIALQLGVSRVPVREALMQLEAIGLVKFSPYKGAVVSTLSPEDAREIFEIRSLLEAEALVLAFPNLSHEALDRAWQLVEEAGEEEDPLKWSEKNWNFHSFLYQFSERPRLIALIRSLHDNVAPYRALYLRSLDSHCESTAAHRRIVQSLRAGRIEDAARLLKEHLALAEMNIIRYLKR